MRARFAFLTLTGFIVGLLAGSAIGAYLARVTSSGADATPAIYVTPHPKLPPRGDEKVVITTMKTFERV